MKLLISVILAVSSPVLATADLAGDWIGVHNTPQGPHHIVLHVTGADTALKATTDSPDQGVYGVPIPSITLSGPTLQFRVPVFDVTFSGELHSDGTIAGTFSQHGLATPLVFERSAVPLPKAAPQTQGGPAGVLQGQRYHHNLTGVEFDLPYGWFIGRTAASDGDPSQMTVLKDPDGRAIFASVFMAKADIPPAAVSGALSGAIPSLIARRSGASGAHAPHTAQAYSVRDVERTSIGGRQAVRAIGDSEQAGRKTTELLTWIYTEHTRAFFFMRMVPENMQALQTTFDQILQSAVIP
ncbi:MAG TPA: hypothetical protein VLY24_07420 [Bryobacteraceae bacterium]|nr:hypothetical protein [Bryobacteraceae bacterium]